MNFPSVSSLLSILVDYARYVAAYYFFGGSWTNVKNRQTELRAWYEQLERWVKYYADYIAAALRSWVTDWINYLESWRVWLKSQADWASGQITGLLHPLWNWYGVYRARLSYFIDQAYNWLMWFYSNPLNAIRYYLGAIWDSLTWWYNTYSARLNYFIDRAYNWLFWFYSDPLNAIRYYLGETWNWLAWLFSNPLGVIEYYLGGVWTWLKAFWSNPLAIIEAYLGAVWAWLKIWYGLRDYNIFGFVRDALTYWYTIWRDYRVNLLQFLSDPVGYILAAIRDAFLDWLEQLIAENW